MPENLSNAELEKSYEAVGHWFKDFTETSIAKPLDRNVLRSVLKDLDCNLEQDEKVIERFDRKHYSFNKRKKSVQAVLGDNYEKVMGFCGQFGADKGVVFRKTQNKVVSFGPRQVVTELIALAVTSEERYSQSDFVTRLTAQAINGKLREMGMSATKDRMAIRVPEYNTITYYFHDDPEDDPRIADLPFAPVSISPDFPNKLWDYMKTLKK